jgi:hypothetical protein
VSAASSHVDKTTGIPLPGTGEGVIWVKDNGEGTTDAPRGGAHYNKVTSWVITPRVREAAREHFGCPTMLGMALEDIPMAGGYGSHWEARLMGPEVMSYGTGSGETYLSNLTVAYLEDTNQYRIDGAIGGRLVTDLAVTGMCNQTGSTATIDFIFGNQANVEVRPVRGLTICGEWVTC